MKIIGLFVGKSRDENLKALTQVYFKRLEKEILCHFQEIPDVKNKSTISEQKQKESKAILSKVLPGDKLCLLDEKGKTYSSLEFASFIGNQLKHSTKRLLFVIGGPYGFSDGLYKRSDEKISLSSMTFPHEMVRLIFAEQLYRAFSILKNHPYHHE